MITLESYKAKVYEVLTKLCALNGAISIKLNNERVKNHPFLASPENMAENDEAIICFTYDSDELYPEKICFCKKKIWLIYKSQSITKECENNLLKLGFESYKIFNFDNTVEYTKLIVSQEDFLDKDTQELALIFNSCILCHQYVHNEILRIPFKGIHALNNKINLDKLNEIINEYEYSSIFPDKEINEAIDIDDYWERRTVKNKVKEFIKNIFKKFL